MATVKDKIKNKPKVEKAKKEDAEYRKAYQAKHAAEYKAAQSPQPEKKEPPKQAIPNEKVLRSQLKKLQDNKRKGPLEMQRLKEVQQKLALIQTTKNLDSKSLKALQDVTSTLNKHNVALQSNATAKHALDHFTTNKTRHSDKGRGM